MHPAQLFPCRLYGVRTMFKLNGLKTYVTLNKKYKGGVLYTPEQVGENVTSLNDVGEPGFC